MGRATRRRIPPRATVEIDTAVLRLQFQKMRAARGLSQAAAAAILGISQGTISSFELGKYNAVRNDTLLAIQSLVDDWTRSRGRRKAAPRIVLADPLTDPTGGCVWCDSPLPRMDRPVRFCPKCGGRQSQAPHVKTTPDAYTRCCLHCGRPVEFQERSMETPAS